MAYGKHRTRRLPNYVLGHAANNHVRDAGPAMRTHHYQVDFLLLCHTQYVFYGHAHNNDRLYIYPFHFIGGFLDKFFLNAPYYIIPRFRCIKIKRAFVSETADVYDVHEIQPRRFCAGDMYGILEGVFGTYGIINRTQHLFYADHFYLSLLY